MASRQQYVLSPLDQHAPKVYTRMALVFPVTDYPPAIDTLQTALNRTCDQLPYLKGRVVEKGISHRHESYISFETSHPGPQLEERSAPAGISSYAQLEFDRTPFPPEIFPSPISSGSSEAPVLATSYTKIEGGLVLCIATYHKVIDGTGYSELLRLIAEHARNAEQEFRIFPGYADANEISERRARILGGKPSVPDHIENLSFEQVLARHPEYTLRSKMSAEKANGVGGAPKSGTGTNKVFAFSGAKIEAVKRRLVDRLPKAYLTVNNILTALIWASITHIRMTRSEGALKASTSKMDYPINGRGLVGKTLLDPPFLGNAICYAQAEISTDRLSFVPSVDDPSVLVPIIKIVADAAAHVDESHVASVVHLSDSNPDLSDLTMSWLFNGPGDLHFISWAQVRVYELDFGVNVGCPKYMRSAFMKSDGVVNMLPRKRNQQGEEMEVSILLRQDDMERLSENAAWFSWLVDES